jgi:hypothetical protein
LLVARGPRAGARVGESSIARDGACADLADLASRISP